MQECEWKAMAYGQVTVKDPFLTDSMKLEKRYLMSLDEKRLLAGFQETAGIRPAAMRYPGWESTEIRGHTMGHYLTALSQLWAAEHDPDVKDRIDSIVDGLAQCQREDGYLSAFPEALFDRVERKEPAWVPWYTMHKIISGVTAAWVYADNVTARRIMERLADWTAARVLSWTEEIQKTVLAVEYGGMNDCLYEVFRITGNPLHAQAAHRFDEMPLFEAMAQRRDILDGLHANTTIPKILGGLKRYEVLGRKEVFYLEMAKNFWDLVIEHHTYLTGGNSEWEHFGRPDILDAERTACNCETCNTYNMLKLSALLFQLTGEKKYADYDERAYVNAILSSQNHETGMTTYFQPMGTGFFKVYSRPYDNFWCCTGTGMENFTKQCENICYQRGDTLCISRFVSAEIKWSEKKVLLETEADLLKEMPLCIRVKDMEEKTTFLEIAVRIPEWAAGMPVMECAAGTGKRIRQEIAGDYLILSGKWRRNDEVRVTVPMELRVHGLPDSERAAAFTYGPFVLSADLGREDLRTDVTGVDVTVPTRDIEVPEYLLIREGASGDWETELKAGMERQEGKLEFVFTGADGRQLRFAPHFLKNDVRYGIYFYFFEQGSRQLEAYCREMERRRRIRRTQREVVPLGNDQYELAFGIRGHETEAGHEQGRRFRRAKPGGWFSYKLQIPREPCSLHVTVRGNARFSIFLERNQWIREVLCSGSEGFEEREYYLPGEYRGKKVRVSFSNENRDGMLELFDEIYISSET